MLRKRLHWLGLKCSLLKQLSGSTFYCMLDLSFSMFRPYWRCYFPNTQAIIYVVDSSDTDRLVVAKEEFHSILEVLLLLRLYPLLLWYIYFLYHCKKTHPIKRWFCPKRFPVVFSCDEWFLWSLIQRAAIYSILQILKISIRLHLC